MKFKITTSAAGSTLPVGNHTATFVSITESKTSSGDALKWTFKLDGGAEASYYTDNKPPTVANKLGRWLSGLSGKPLTDGVDVNPDDYVGKRYLLVVAPNQNGKPSLYTLSALAS